MTRGSIYYVVPQQRGLHYNLHESYAVDIFPRILQHNHFIVHA